MTSAKFNFMSKIYFNTNEPTHFKAIVFGDGVAYPICDFDFNAVNDLEICKAIKQHTDKKFISGAGEIVLMNYGDAHTQTTFNFNIVLKGSKRLVDLETNVFPLDVEQMDANDSALPESTETNND